MDCDSCSNYIQREEAKQSCSLIEIKDLGGLVRPNSEIVRVIQVVDKIIEEVRKCDGLSTSDLFRNVMLVRCMMHINENLPNLMNNMCDIPSHKISIVKKIVCYYSTVKIGHMCKSESETLKRNIRHMSKKMPIFNHE